MNHPFVLICGLSADMGFDFLNFYCIMYVTISEVI